MSKRAPRKSETKAAVIATLILQYVKTGDGKPVVTREQARTMTPEEIFRSWRRRVIRQHGGAHATDGLDHPANWWFTAREIDALETPKDISRIAKGKRIRKKLEPHRALLLSKVGQAPADAPLPTRKKVKASIPGSRDTPWRRKLNGRTERRT